MSETPKTIAAKTTTGIVTITSTVAVLAILGYYTYAYLPFAAAPGGHFAAVLLGVYALIALAALAFMGFVVFVFSITAGQGVFSVLGLE